VDLFLGIKGKETVGEGWRRVVSNNSSTKLVKMGYYIFTW